MAAPAGSAWKSVDATRKTGPGDFPKKVLILAAPGTVGAALLGQLLEAGMEAEVVTIEDLPAWKMVRPEFEWRDFVDDAVKPLPPAEPMKAISPNQRQRHGGPHMPTWFASLIQRLFCPRPSKHFGGWHHHGFTCDQRRARRRRERNARSAHYRRLRAIA